MPLGWLLAVLLLTTFATFFFYDYLVGSVGVAVVTATIMIITAFLFVAVATYIVGLVGSSNSPVSGMTICALLIAAGTLLGLGIRGESAILATLGVAGVVCCATCTAGDIAQDLKTGQLVGATPARQQWTEILGAIIPAFFFAPILSLLHKAYGIGTGAPGALRAPQATLFASLTSSFFGEGDLPLDMIGIGVAIGVGLIVLNRLLELSGSSFRTHVMPVAVGIYLPLSLVIPIFLGGLIRYVFSRRSVGDSPSEAHDSGILFGSGLIAGEAITGILLAIPISLGYKLREAEGNWAVSLLIFGAVIALYASLRRRSCRAAS
jgi:putative OPT family oligopeptide transporter